MGLWKSKMKGDVNIENPMIGGGEIFISEGALKNVLKSSSQDSNQPASVKSNSTEQTSKEATPAQASPDLFDQRIAQYESTMITNLDQASKYVENLFRERYKTIPICNELQKSVSKCYSENPKLTLNCSEIANQFIKCVEEERQSRLGAKSFSSKKTSS